MMERRDFLSTLAASPAVALLPRPGASDKAIASAPVPAPGSTQFYFASMVKRDGRMLPDEIAGSAEAIYRYDSEERKKKTPVKRFPFIPFDSEKRFTICDTQWEAPRPSFYDLHRATDDQEKFGALLRDWHEATETIRLPTSLVDVLEHPSNGEDGLSGDVFVTRAEALEWAAELNGDRLEMDSENIRGMYWAVVVELGQPVMRPDVSIEFETNGIGKLDREVQWPVRVVCPTSEELARFPLPAGVILD